ncbi:OprO/OprP family phosphate-selective porin, partial [Parvibaculum sp.]|uniref:OprO/OprP family phosphate-selective porin n=1 Tax=Parvibaculum sp. TaxID=2024848 RepID=UPI002BF68B48
INTMKQQIMDLQQRLDDLQISQGNELKEIKEKQDAVQIDFKDGKPTFKTGDGLFEMSIRGRAHFDVATGDTDGTLTPYNNGANFRRAEIGVEGKFMRDWGYVLGLQFGGTKDSSPTIIKEAYLSYNGISGIKIQGGAIGVPLTLDYATSSNDITFIERSSAANMMISLGSDDSRTAFGVRGNTDNVFGMLYYTKDTVGTDATTHAESDNVVGRVAVAFQPVEKSNIHLGLSGTYTPHFYKDPSIGDRPGIRVDDIKYISTPSITKVDKALFYGPELAVSYGPFKAQGEYYRYSFDRTLGAADADFSAWYAQASWVITGEAYKYSMDGAAYKGVKPASPFTLGGGIGAWELAVRYSTADLNDSGSGLTKGGEEKMWTGGLNWYVNNNVRFMLDYIRAKEEGGGPKGEGTFNSVALRTQFAF